MNLNVALLLLVRTVVLSWQKFVSKYNAIFSVLRVRGIVKEKLWLVAIVSTINCLFLDTSFLCIE